MKTILRHTLSGLALAAFATVAGAQAASPVGLWKTIDDGTKKEKSLVRIVESGGVFSGRVERVLDPEVPKDAVCKDCTDERKDQPIVGMTIIRHMKQNADDKALFDGGDIVDPKDGKVYKSRMKLVEGGARLEVRGYIGVPMLGRTQTWVRAE